MRILFIFITGTLLLLNGPIRAQKILYEMYYQDANRKKKAVPEKSAYVLTGLLLEDGSVEEKLTERASGRLLSQEHYPYVEPFSTEKEGKAVIDYNFPLVYTPVSADTLNAIPIGKYMQDHPSLGYKAPVLEYRLPDVNQYLANNVRYPEFPREHSISGRVVVQFRIDEAGKMQDLSVIKGVHPALDKETMRVLRGMQFRQPARLKDAAYPGYLSLVVKYMLE